jgi:hypothetical protein
MTFKVIIIAGLLLFKTDKLKIKHVMYMYVNKIVPIFILLNANVLRILNTNHYMLEKNK